MEMRRERWLTAEWFAESEVLLGIVFIVLLSQNKGTETSTQGKGDPFVSVLCRNSSFVTNMERKASTQFTHIARLPILHT